MTNPFLVGFSGKPGSAKNHFSFKLMQELRFQGYTVFKGSLASSLYADVNTIIDSVKGKSFDVTALHIDSKYEKELITLASGDVGVKHEQYGYSRRNENVRRLLTLLGGTVRREQDENYLLKNMLENAPSKDFILFTDLRFPSEADYTNSHGAAVRCEVNDHWVNSTKTTDDGFKYSTEAVEDETETALDDYEDWFIKLMYNRNRPILFAHSLLRAHGFPVNKHEFFRAQPQ